MTRLARKAALLAACGIFLGVAVATAGVPSPGNCSFSKNIIDLVGQTAGTPDALSPNAALTITVRDVGNNPINNSTVVIDLSADLSDTRFGSSQAYGTTFVNCGNHQIYATTNASGQVTFVVVGGGLGSAAPSHPANGAKVYADGVLISGAGLKVASYDEDGGGGVGGSDLSIFANDLFNHPSYERSDFDGSGAVGGADLSLFSNTLFGGRSTASASTYCP